MVHDRVDEVVKIAAPLHVANQVEYHFFFLAIRPDVFQADSKTWNSYANPAFDLREKDLKVLLVKRSGHLLSKN